MTLRRFSAAGASASLATRTTLRCAASRATTDLSFASWAAASAAPGTVLGRSPTMTTGSPRPASSRSFWAASTGMVVWSFSSTAWYAEPSPNRVPLV